MVRKHRKKPLHLRVKRAINMAIDSFRQGLNSLLDRFGLFLTDNNRLSVVLGDRENPDPDDCWARQYVFKDILSGRTWFMGYTPDGD